MAQVKKESVRESILESANSLFTEKDYSTTTLADIAKLAGVTMSNIYNYFGSKLDILFAIYEPWLIERLEQLEQETFRLKTPRAQLRHVLLTVLRDIPSENNNFANNVLQAIATRQSEEPYSRALLLQSESKVSKILSQILPAEVQAIVKDDALSHFLFMAFDGFSVNYRLVGPSRRVEAIVDMLCDLILAPAHAQAE